MPEGSEGQTKAWDKALEFARNRDYYEIWDAELHVVTHDKDGNEVHTVACVEDANPRYDEYHRRWVLDGEGQSSWGTHDVEIHVELGRREDVVSMLTVRADSPFVGDSAIVRRVGIVSEGEEVGDV